MSIILPIERWDAIYQNGYNVPAIYIKNNPFPFLTSQDVIVAKVSFTESMYDEMYLLGTIQKSENTGGYRPNFQAETGLYCIPLVIQWSGYPKKMGVVEISLQNNA